MTTAQKLETMDAIWADLSRTPETFATPVWHKSVLDERRAAVVAGTATYSDWSEAKRRLKKKLA